MSNVLKNLYNNPLDSDIRINLQSGSVLYVHSLILKNHSQVLRMILLRDQTDQLQFKHSDSAVTYVIHSMYHGCNNIVSPQDIYGAIKFAQYLQMDSLIEHIVKHADTRKRMQMLRISKLMSQYNETLYVYCIRYALRCSDLLYFAEILYGIARDIKPSVYNWLMEQLCADNFPDVSMYYTLERNSVAIILTIFYADKHNLPDLAFEAINSIDMDMPGIKRNLREVVAHKNFPHKYIYTISAIFAQHARYVDTCGCANVKSYNQCDTCQYKWCLKCNNGSQQLAWNEGSWCNECSQCPRCRFVVKGVNACVNCIIRDICNGTLIYCCSHRRLTAAALHKKCARITKPEMVMDKFKKLYSNVIENMMARRLDNVIWKMSVLTGRETA